MKIENSIALVTGANGGIGSSLVEELINRGAKKVYATARNTEKLYPLISKYSERIVAVELDVTSDKSINDLVSKVKDINLLINNAGISFDEGFISSKDFDHAEQEMSVNYLGPIKLIRGFVDVLKENDGGAILNILSFLSHVTMPLAGSYSASKAAALSMTRGVRAELASQGTLVVGSMPAQVDTELAKNYPEPKVKPINVAIESLDAIENGLEDVFPGDLAKEYMLMVLSDPKQVEKNMAVMLPA